MSDQEQKTANSAKPKQGLALVTAGSRRLGRATCLRLAELGWDIALHYNSSEDEAKVAAREIEAGGGTCQIFQRDFDHIDEVLTLIPEIRETMGTPTLLINNASIFERGSLIDATVNDFDRNFNVHVKAPFFLMRDFAKDCEKGQIINIVDTMVKRYRFNLDHFTYLVSKKALYELTKMAANELAPKIRVNAVAPGIILPVAGSDNSTYEKSSTANPLHRAGSPADILKAIEYLLSNEQVTGECLFVDGGNHIEY